MILADRRTHKAMALQTGPDKQTEERIKKLEAAFIKYKGELEDYKNRDSLAQVRPSADTGRPVVPLVYDSQSGPPIEPVRIRTD